MTNNRAVEAAMQRWLEVAVIGLNLCPFAKAVQARRQIRYAVSDATDTAGLLEAVRNELLLLQSAPAELHDTTLLCVPDGLADFTEFNWFLDEADRLLCALELEGEIQIASFHPQYQFAGTQASDITNFTNRAPYPALHFLREASIERVLANFPDPDSIYQNNMTTLERLGHAGWNALNVGTAPAERLTVPVADRADGHTATNIAPLATKATQ